MLFNSIVSRTLQLLTVAWFVTLGALSAPESVIAQDASAKAKQAKAPQPPSRQDAFNQLKYLGVALHNYHEAKGSFPPAAILSPEGKPLLSWRVALLPYLDVPQLKLYQQFDLTQPWDSQQNLPLVAQMPDLFRCPGSKSPAGTTVYLAPRGGATLFTGPTGTSVRKVTDGLSNTIAIVEVSDQAAVPWTKPEDWQLNLAAPAQQLGGHFPGVLLTLFADGSAHALPATIANDKLNALLTPSGGEVISHDP